MGVGNVSSRGKQTRLRHVWLASLGALVVVRREARGVMAAVPEAAARLRDRIAQRGSEARGGGRKPATRKPAARRQAARKKASARPASARRRAERRVASRGR